MATITECRICGSTALEPVVDLGSMPLANDVRSPNESPGPKYPLAAIRCTHCSLVQITETVEAETLFRDYAYFSSFSESFVDHARRFAEREIEQRRLNGDSLVLEVASNDGYLLKHFVERGVRVLGVEPARNVAVAARDVGVPTIDEFFDQRLAEQIVAEHGHAQLVIANNVLAHVADLHSVVAGLATVIGRDGVLTVETPYLLNMIDRREFDTIYHEHLCYYSLTALTELLALHGLRVIDVEQLAVHGGSLRISCAAGGDLSERVQDLLTHEEAWGIRSPERYEEFAADVNRIIHDLPMLLDALRAKNQRVAGYGAAAKASVMINACDLDVASVPYVVDRNPVKQGRMIPGTAIPIVDPARIVEDRPDYLIVFVWNILDEIRRQQQSYLASGGQLIVPVPRPRVV